MAMTSCLTFPQHTTPPLFPGVLLAAASFSLFFQHPLYIQIFSGYAAVVLRISERWREWDREREKRTLARPTYKLIACQSICPSVTLVELEQTNNNSAWLVAVSVDVWFLAIISSMRLSQRRVLRKYFSFFGFNHHRHHHLRESHVSLFSHSHFAAAAGAMTTTIVVVIVFIAVVIFIAPNNVSVFHGIIICIRVSHPAIHSRDASTLYFWLTTFTPNTHTHAHRHTLLFCERKFSSGERRSGKWRRNHFYCSICVKNIKNWKKKILENWGI